MWSSPLGGDNSVIICRREGDLALIFFPDRTPIVSEGAHVVVVKWRKGYCYKIYLRGRGNTEFLHSCYVVQLEYPMGEIHPSNALPSPDLLGLPVN